MSNAPFVDTSLVAGSADLMRAAAAAYVPDPLAPPDVEDATATSEIGSFCTAVGVAIAALTTQTALTADSMSVAAIETETIDLAATGSWVPWPAG